MKKIIKTLLILLFSIISWLVGVLYGGIKSIALQYIIASFKSGRNDGINFMNKLIK